MAGLCKECGRPLTDSETRFRVTRCGPCTQLREKTPGEMFAAGAETSYVITSLRARGFRKQDAEYLADKALRGEPIDPEVLQVVQAESTAVEEPLGEAAAAGGLGSVVIGLALVGLSVGISVGTYMAAEPGGLYLIFWGPGVYGAYLIVRGTFFRSS